MSGLAHDTDCTATATPTPITTAATTWADSFTDWLTKRPTTVKAPSAA